MNKTDVALVCLFSGVQEHNRRGLRESTQCTFSQIGLLLVSRVLNAALMDQLRLFKL